MAPGEQRPRRMEGEEVVTRMTPAVQRATDRAVAVVFLWAIPRWVRPNHLTVLRFALIPVILVLLGTGHPWWGLGAFVAGICTDFIDGAMARTRGQITLLGIYLDPLADKLLVAAVLAWIGHHYLIVDIILGFIVLELCLSAVGARILLRTGTGRSSNAFGKTKMIVQSVALLLFLIARILESDTLTTIALYLLWLALALAIASGVTQIMGMKKQPRADRPA